MMADDTPPTEPSVDYPWYRKVDDGSLEQGDILLDYPWVMIISSYDEICSGQSDSKVRTANVIIVTQSCDLSRGKVDHILVCPFFTAEQLSNSNPSFKELRKKDGLKNVKKGRYASLYLLPPFTVAGTTYDSCIVNFRQILSVPLDHVIEHASRQQKRIRLCPPYREDLAQAFARFIMRIGLPNDNYGV